MWAAGELLTISTDLPAHAPPLSARGVTLPHGGGHPRLGKAARLCCPARARAPVAESHAWEKPCPPLPVPRPCPIPQLINPRLPEVVAPYFPAAPTPPTSTRHPSPHSSLHPILPCTHLCTPPCPTLTLHLFTVHPSHHCMVSWAPGAESTLAWPPEA